MFRLFVALGFLGAIAAVACAPARADPPPPVDPAPAPLSATPTATNATSIAPAQRPADGSVVEVPIEGDLPAFVVRPAASAAAQTIHTVFLTGSCTHPLDTIQAFGAAAAEHGGLVALQGDIPCKGSDGRLRKWSNDSAATEARIEAALAAAGGASSGLTLMGYSQGAERAEWIGHRFHAKYTHFVLMAGPGIPSPSRFEGARAVVTLAGHGDVRENMALGAKRLRRAKIPAIYMEIPTITHGELAPGAGAVVSQAFDWLESNGNARTSDGEVESATPKARPHRRAKRR